VLDVIKLNESTGQSVYLFYLINQGVNWQKFGYYEFGVHGSVLEHSTGIIVNPLFFPLRRGRQEIR